jgi:hypothetical protein
LAIATVDGVDAGLGWATGWAAISEEILGLGVDCGWEVATMGAAAGWYDAVVVFNATSSASLADWAIIPEAAPKKKAAVRIRLVCFVCFIYILYDLRVKKSAKSGDREFYGLGRRRNTCFSRTISGSADSRGVF